jgi:hypothetical protein
VNAICPLDINNDGYIDLVLGGNQWVLPQFTRLDSNFGSVLLGNKKVFYLENYNESGFFLKEKLNI